MAGRQKRVRCRSKRSAGFAASTTMVGRVGSPPFPRSCISGACLFRKTRPNPKCLTVQKGKRGCAATRTGTRDENGVVPPKSINSPRRCVRLGTRSSALARWQSDWVDALLGNVAKHFGSRICRAPGARRSAADRRSMGPGIHAAFGCGRLSVVVRTNLIRVRYSPPSIRCIANSVS